MACRKITVGLESSPKPCDRFLVSAELRFGIAHPDKPNVGTRISRAKSERLLYMSLRFFAATGDELGATNERMSGSQISI